MKNWGGQFTPKLGGHFELESGGHFKLKLGGQYHWNLQSDTQAFDGSVTENSLFKTLGTIKYLCLEFVVTLNFLLNLLLKPS